MTVNGLDEDALRARVQHERRVRGLSVRRAAALGNMSNTTWGHWENGRHDLTDTVRVGVAQAFDWSTDWPEFPPSVRQPDPAEPTTAELAAMLTTLIELVGDMGHELRALAARLPDSPGEAPSRSPRAGRAPATRR